MKRSLLALPVLALTSLALISCDSSSNEAASGDSSAAATPTTTAEPSLIPMGGTTKGEIGKVHGTDCVAPGDCSITFKVSELTRVSSCTDSLGQITNGNLIHVNGTISSKTETRNPNFIIDTWPVFAQWSTVGADGIDMPIEISYSCLPETGNRGTWKQEIRPGDTRAFNQYMEIPEGAETLRITDQLNGGGRWEFSIPAESDGPRQSDSAPEPTIQKDAPSALSMPPVEHPAPAPAPVVGITGAPSVETVRQLDKSIASCGDPRIHQTGTTFFTDGTSGWTENCASQMATS